MKYDASAVKPHYNLAQGKSIGKYGKMSSGAGDFGMTPTLGGKPEVKCPDAGKRFSDLTDAQRCCGPPSGTNQRNADHGKFS